MKIAFVTTYDAEDIRSWSGTAYYMAKSLIEAGVEVEFIGDLKNRSEKSLKSRLRNLLYSRILSKKYGKYQSQYQDYP